LGNGEGAFRDPILYSTEGEHPGSLIVGDFNNDGHADLAAANEGSGTISILLGNGDGTFQAGRSFGAGSGPGSIAAADFNGDGRTDIVAVNRAHGTISILLGNGDGSFAPPAPIAVGADPVALVVEDFNSDGRPDIAVANGRSAAFTVLMGTGGGGFLTGVQYPLGDTPLSMVTGDLNGDGKPDLQFYLAGKTIVWTGKGDGRFAVGYSTTLGPSLMAAALGDFNADGRIDVAGVDRTGALYVLLADKPLMRPPGAVFSLGTSSITVASAGGVGNVLLAAAAPWTATSNSPWLHLTAANSSGSGNAVVSFTFDANPNQTPQIGSLTIAGLTFNVSQAGTGYVAVSPVNTLISAGLNSPGGIAVDSLGNVYIANTLNSLIKQWNPVTQAVTPVVSSGINNPGGVAVDSQGNLYIADTGNNAIEEWNAATQQFTVLVSSGLANPNGVAVDSQGNVYISDTGNNAIEEWNVGSQQFSVLVSAGLNAPHGVAVDILGNVYIADTGNNAVEQWNVANQQLVALVGTGLNAPSAVAVDGQGNLYIADTSDNELQEWNAATQQLAPLQSTGLNLPAGVALDAAGDVYLADTANNAVKEEMFAYLGPASLTEGAAAGADTVQVLPSTTIFNAVSDQSWLTITGTSGGEAAFSFQANTSVSNRTAHVSLLGVQVTVTQNGDTPAALTKSAGDGQSTVAGQAFATPLQVIVMDAEGNLVQGAAVTFSAMPGTTGASGAFGPSPTMPVLTGQNGSAAAPPLTANNTAGQFTVLASAGGVSVTFALTNVMATLGAASTTVGGSGGNGSVLVQVNPPGGAWTAVSNSSWIQISPGSASGTGSALVYFTVSPNAGPGVQVGTITIDGQTFTVTEAGNGFVTINELTTLISQGLNLPYAVALDSQGNLYIADTGHDEIQKWSAATGQMTPLVSTAGLLNAPHGVAVDASGNVYIADAYHDAIEEWVAATQQVVTLVPSSSGLNFPLGVAVDGQGNVYIADSGNNAIKEWNPSTQQVTTLVSSGLKNPTGVGVDSLGNVYIADFEDSAIKEWNPVSQQVTALSAPGLSFPNSITLDGEDNLYLIDGNNNALKEWNAANQAMNTLVPSGVTGAFGVATDGQGNFYIASTSSSAVQKISLAYLGLGATSKSEGPQAGSDSVSYQVLPANTLVAATSNQVWLTVTGTTGGVISFAFSANTSVTPRTGIISVQGQQITVSQGGDVPASIASSAGNGQQVSPGQTFPVPLQVTVTDSVGSPVSGALVSFGVIPGMSGANGTLGSTQPVATNASGVATAPALTANGIAGTFAVTATANGLTVTFSLSINASFALGASSVTVGGAPGKGTVELVANASWTATSNATWLQVSPASASGAGNALVGFTYNANPNSSAQTGTLTIGGLTFAVTQAGSAYSQVLPVSSLVSGLNQPEGVAVDASGNVYIADTANNAVKEWNVATQAVSVLVGTGLNAPASVAVDTHGNVYIADTGNKMVKEWVAATQTVTVLVPSGLASPRGVAVDTMGDVFIADSVSNAILEWSAITQQVTTVVNSGLNGPSAVALDRFGNVYIADTGNNAIKEWSASNAQVTALVSSGLSGPSGVAVDGQGNVDIGDTGNNMVKQWNAASGQVLVLISTGLTSPSGVAVDSQGNIYLADTHNNAVKKLSFGYLLLGSSTLAEGAASGTGSVSTQVIPTGIPLTAASDSSWLSITSVPVGLVNFSFQANTSVSSRVAHITVVSPQFTVTQSGDTPTHVTPAAGNNQSAAPGAAFPTALEVTVTDTNGLAVQGASVTFTVTPGSTGASGTFASSVPIITNQNGQATASVLTANLIAGSFTVTASVSGASAGVFTLTNLTYTLAGSSVSVGSAAGGDSVELIASSSWTATANATWLHLPLSSGTGNAVIAFNYDANTSTANRTGTLTISGLTFTVSQAGTSYVPVTSSTVIVPTGIKTPEDVALDSQGDVYIADSGDSAIKEWLATTQVVNTLVSSGLSSPYGVALDSHGNVYIADSKDNEIKEWNLSNQTVTVLVGSGLSTPFGIAVDSSGNIYFSDSGHNSIKEWVASSGTVSTLASGLSSPRGIAVDAQGNVYVADTGNNEIKEWNAVTKAVTVLVSSGLSGPSGVAVDTEDNVYIADTGNNAIKRWSPSTTTVTTLVSSGIKSPGGVAVDGQGNLYIADTGDSAIDKVILAFLALGTVPTEPATVGTGSVSVQVLPSTEPLTASSSQTWLTITGVAGGAISFSFTANTSVSTRSAVITVLGQQVTVTQSGDTPFSITKTAGNGQSVTAGQAYPTALQVQVKDVAGNAVQGASVTFTTTAGAKGSNGAFSSSAPVITGSSGIATASTLTANTVAGAFTATATVNGISTAFTLTITAK
jgi:DNA-binding beta-propeller fold protein YncE